MAIPIIVLLAAGVGVLIGAPVLRLRGDYLAIVTLGFGEMVPILISSNWLRPLGWAARDAATSPTPRSPAPRFRDPQHFYYLVLAFVSVRDLHLVATWRTPASVAHGTRCARTSRWPTPWAISTTRYKLLAFAIGGAVGSLGGALFAVQDRRR